MRVKGDNLELINGLIHHLLYLEQGEGKRTIERRGKRRGNKALGNWLLDHESSVKVGYGFYAIRSRLLIANDMCWVVL